MPDYGHQITKLGTLEGVHNNQATEAKYLTMNSNSEAKYQQFKSIAMQVNTTQLQDGQPSMTTHMSDHKITIVHQLLPSCPNTNQQSL